MSDHPQNQRQALLIGYSYGILWTLPQLLSRAGFQVDVIIESYMLKKAKFVRHAEALPDTASLQAAIARKNLSDYDWIIPTNETLFSEILNFDLPLQDKLKCLPVLSEKDFPHLNSKIGLSQTFARHGILTPAFRIATNPVEAATQAETLGYPVLLKEDVSSGGDGVFECNKAADIAAIKPSVWGKPVLVQKKIEGQEMDLSALFLESKLIHFNCAKIEKTCKKFGPSWLRTYSPLSEVDPAIFTELSAIGKALGAHGFTNISCIESKNGERHYIETDMRSNVWVEFPRFFGDDPAPKIQKWFASRETLRFPVPKSAGQPTSIRIPYFLRMKRRDILLNRYRVWNYIPFDDKKLVRRLLIRHFLSFSLKPKLFRLLKFCTPPKYQPLLKQKRCDFKAFLARHKFYFLAEFL